MILDHMHHQLSDTPLVSHATLSLPLASHGLNASLRTDSFVALVVSLCNNITFLALFRKTSYFSHNMVESEKKFELKLLKDLFDKSTRVNKLKQYIYVTMVQTKNPP